MSPPKRRRPPPTRRSPTPGRPTKKRKSAGARGKVGGSGAKRAAPRRAGGPRGLGGEQVEGRQAVRELLVAGRRRVREVVVATKSDDEVGLDDLVELARAQRALVREIGPNKLAGMARTEAPQGVIALAAPLVEHDLEDLARADAATPPFLLALDGVTDPGNLGALLRTAECAGVTGVLLPRHRAVHVTPAVTKAAAGAVEHLRLALVGGLPTALGRLSELGVWTVGFDAGGAHSLFEPLPTLAEPVCIVLGAEGRGLSRLARQRCDTVVSIPLGGQVASLNVSTAGALALFEVVRARSGRA